MAASLLSPACLLGGCAQVERVYDSKLTGTSPVEWWHQLEGGQVAQDRPPPPGATDPYPNLAEVPPRPAPTDAVTRRAIAAKLASQRDIADRAAKRDPLPPPRAANVIATPSPVAAFAPDPNASTAVLDAASAAPAPPPIASAPATPAPVAFIPATRRSPASLAPTQTAAGLPTLPEAPPAAPGVEVVEARPAPHAAPPGVAVTFASGSAKLARAGTAALQDLAARRGAAAIAVKAGGDAASQAPRAQAAALPLALRRAQAIAAALTASGVPGAAIHVDADAPGRRGSARLIE